MNSLQVQENIFLIYFRLYIMNFHYLYKAYVYFFRTISIDTEMSQSGKIFSKLQCLNVSSNILDNSTAISRVIEAIPSLRSIDLSHNNISYMPIITRKENFSVYLESILTRL